jgi:hypothetical protein
MFRVVHKKLRMIHVQLFNNELAVYRSPFSCPAVCYGDYNPALTHKAL